MFNVFFRMFQSVNGVVNLIFVYMATPKSEMFGIISLILYPIPKVSCASFLMLEVIMRLF